MRRVVVFVLPAASVAVITAFALIRPRSASFAIALLESFRRNVRVLPPGTVSVLRAMRLPFRLSFTVIAQLSSARGQRTRSFATPLSETFSERPSTSTFGCVVSPPPPATPPDDAIVNERLAEPVLPRASVARTTIVCAPTARLLYFAGLAQLANAPPSSLQATVAASLTLNGIEAPVPDTAGFPIVTFGAVVSTTNDLVALPTLPTASLAVT